MPVLECSCGMVMSVSVAKPRITCIRCGGAEFRELQHFDLVVNTMDNTPLLPLTTCGNGLRISPWSLGGKAASSLAVGSTSLNACEVLVNREFTI
jgi:hypothetical protein